jgi:hypothetical protein
MSAKREQAFKTDCLVVLKTDKCLRRSLLKDCVPTVAHKPND